MTPTQHAPTHFCPGALAAINATRLLALPPPRHNHKPQSYDPEAVQATVAQFIELSARVSAIMSARANNKHLARALEPLRLPTEFHVWATGTFGSTLLNNPKPDLHVLPSTTSGLRRLERDELAAHCGYHGTNWNDCFTAAVRHGHSKLEAARRFPQSSIGQEFLARYNAGKVDRWGRPKRAAVVVPPKPKASPIDLNKLLEGIL